MSGTDRNSHTYGQATDGSSRLVESRMSASTVPSAMPSAVSSSVSNTERTTDGANRYCPTMSHFQAGLVTRALATIAGTGHGRPSQRTTDRHRLQRPRRVLTGRGLQLGQRHERPPLSITKSLLGRGEERGLAGEIS